MSGTAAHWIVGVVTAITLTTLPEHRSIAFDKQTCAAAYENAQQLRAKLKLRLAREQLLVCGHSSCPLVVTKDCNAWLEEVETDLPSFVFRPRDSAGRDIPNARVLIDGEHLSDKMAAGAIFVDPGMHVFRFEAEGYTNAEVNQMVRRGDRARTIDVMMRGRQDELGVRSDQESSDKWDGGAPVADAWPDDRALDARPPLEMQLMMPQAARSSPGTGTFVAAGVGVLALSSFAYFGLTASSDASNLRESCAPHCRVEDVDSVRTKLVVANVSLGVGIVALGVAGALWLAEGSSAPRAASTFRFDVAPAPHGRGFVAGTTFSVP